MDQNFALQMDALREAGCEKIYVEKASGSHRDRPQLKAALEYLRDGDAGGLETLPSGKVADTGDQNGCQHRRTWHRPEVLTQNIRGTAIFPHDSRLR